MNSFIPWVGGKGKLLWIINKLMPDRYTRFIDVFGGSGTVTMCRPIQRGCMEVYNDFNGNLTNLFCCVKNRPMALLAELGFLPLNTRDDFNVLYKFFSRGEFTDDYMNRLDQLSRDELIQAADEISAMMTCHSELMAFGENLSRKKMIFLLQQEKPLELLSEAWMEHQTVDVGETFQSLLTGLYDETQQTQVCDMVYAIQPKTIEELLTSYPDDYFQLMTPCGFVDLTPSETEKLLHGEATMAHPGVSGCQMPVEAQELLEMEVLSLKRDEHGCWYALTDHPQQKMEQAPQEPLML